MHAYARFRRKNRSRRRTTDMSQPSSEALVSPESRNSSSTGLADVFRSLSSHTMQSLSDSAASGTISSPVRKPLYADYNDLLANLNLNRPAASRISAAEELAKDFDQPTSFYLASPLNSAGKVMQLWNMCKDMIDKNTSPQTRRAGFAVLAACCTRTYLSQEQRQIFYETITGDYCPENFDRQIDALISLTNNGRDIDPFENLILPLLNGWIELSFQLNVTFRQQKKRDKLPKVNAQYPQVLLDQLLAFTKKVLEEGEDRSFSDEQLETLLYNLTNICKRTSNPGDIQASTQIFLSVLEKHDFPQTALPACIEVMCGAYRSVKSLSNDAWNGIVKLLKEPTVSQQCVEILLGILTFSAQRPPETLNSACGAALVLGNLWRMHGKDGLPEISLTRLIDALNIALARKHPKLDTDVLTTICGLFDGPEIADITLSKDWTHLFDVLGTRKISVAVPDIETDHTANSIKSDMPEQTMEQGLRRMITLFEGLWSRLSTAQKETVVKYFVSVRPFLEEGPCRLVVNFYREEHLCYAKHPDWMIKRNELIDLFILDPVQKADSVRLLALETVKEAFLADKESDAIDESTPETIIDNITKEESIAVLDSTIDFALAIVNEGAIQEGDDVTFDLVHEQLRKLSVVAISSPTTPTTNGETQSAANAAVTGLVKLFLRSLSSSAYRTQKTYDSLLDIASSDNYQVDIRLTVYRLLFRLRSNQDFSIRVIPSLEDECPTNTLLKNFRSSQTHENHSLKRLSGSDSRVSRPRRPPVWMCYEQYGLPEQPAADSSKVIFSKLVPHHPHNGVNNHSPTPAVALEIKFWLEKLISYLQSGEDWELYSYIIVHLASQLTNTPLFENCMLQIQLLRSVICEQLKSGSFHEPPPPTGLKKGDVALCLLHTLSVLLIYRNHFSQHEEDEMVRTFMLGIGSWDGTSRTCIHMLSLCCHEIPLSITKALKAILLKMSQIITQPRIAMHILEFLGNLARLPEIYRNLQDDELRIIFGICIKFLEHSREQRQIRESVEERPSRRSVSSHDRVSSPERIETCNPSDDLPQYVYALAYHVMTFWFLSLKLQDRAKHVGWISKSLIWRDAQGREMIEEQGQVFLDMMQRTAFSDLGETKFEPRFCDPSDGKIISKSWLVGLSIVTVHTAMTSGVSQVTKRQASGTTHFIYYQNTAQLPPHHIQPPIETRSGSEDLPDMRTNIFPSHVLLQLCGSAAALPPNMQPIPLPDDDLTRRALSSFDRNNTVDGHKIGVVYVSKGQTLEADILGNCSGTVEYETFVAGLGTLVQLQGATFNTQGLDRVANADGEYTFAWRDRVTEIIFHIATMMPTDKKDDPQCVNKKRHIGNDFVNIIYNDSGSPYKFDTISSAFNYVNIVITPSSTITLSEGAKHFPSYNGQPMPFYKVQVHSKPGFPSISPAAEPKFISGKNLSAFVRFLALNASVFSLTWANRADGMEHISPWLNRLREIRKLKDRVVANANAAATAARTAAPGPSTQRRVSYIPMTDGSSHRLSAIGIDGSGVADMQGLVEEYDFSKWA